MNLRMWVAPTLPLSASATCSAFFAYGEKVMHAFPFDERAFRWFSQRVQLTVVTSTTFVFFLFLPVEEATPR